MEILHNESLKKYTTVKIGGIAEKLYFPESVEELVDLSKNITSETLYVISGGSNLLINDERVFSEVINLKKMDTSIRKLGYGKYYIGASVRLQEAINHINNDGYGGIEYLYSLPALLGGAIAMNAGRGKIHNLCISDYIKSVYVYDYENDELKTLDKQECQFGYRNSIFKKNKLIVLGANFHFDNIDREEAKKRRKDRIELVKKLQDSSGFNFGSVFRKHNKYIMQLVKLFSIGYKDGMKFSNKTSNWMINQGKGNYSQACILMDKVTKSHKLFGIEAIPEVIRWD